MKTTTITPETIEMRKQAIKELTEYYGHICTDMKRAQEKHNVGDTELYNELMTKYSFLSDTSRFFTYLELDPHIKMNIFVKDYLYNGDSTKLRNRDIGANNLAILGYNIETKDDGLSSYKLALKALVEQVCVRGYEPQSISFVKMVEWSEDGVDIVRRENMARLYKNNKWRYELTQVFEC